MTQKYWCAFKNPKNVFSFVNAYFNVIKMPNALKTWKKFFFLITPYMPYSPAYSMPN